MNQWIARHAGHMRASGFSENTVEDRVHLLNRLDRELPMGLVEVTIEELEHWLSGPIKPTWSNQTKATYYGHIVGFFRWAADPNRYPHLSYDPSVSLSRPTVPQTMPRPVTDQELAEILDVTKGRWRVYCLLAAYAGLRCCEIASVRRDDITQDTITIKGKGGKNAALPTHPIIWEAVRDLPSGPIAQTKAGRPVSATYVSKMGAIYLTRALRRPGVTLHRLRHWFATSALNNGANLRVVQELMRHSSPSTTAIYTQITDEQRKMAVSALLVPVPSATKQ